MISDDEYVSDSYEDLEELGSESDEGNSSSEGEDDDVSTSSDDKTLTDVMEWKKLIIPCHHLPLHLRFLLLIA